MEQKQKGSYDKRSAKDARACYCTFAELQNSAGLWISIPKGLCLWRNSLRRYVSSTRSPPKKINKKIKTVKQDCGRTTVITESDHCASHPDLNPLWIRSQEHCETVKVQTTPITSLFIPQVFKQLALEVIVHLKPCPSQQHMKTLSKKPKKQW